MKRFLVLAVLTATLSAQEPITRYIASIPTFNTCKDALDLTKRPTLTPEAAAVKDSDGNAVYSINNAVNIDIQAGFVKYKLMHGSTVFEEITVPVPECTQEDTAAVQKVIADAGNFAQKLDLLIQALPATTAEIDAKIDENNTKSSAMSQSFRLVESKDGSDQNQFFNEFFKKFKDVWGYALTIVGLLGVAAGVVIMASGWIFAKIDGSKVGFFEENGRRLFGGAIMLILFFGVTTNGLSPAHAIWGWFVKKGDQLASVASGAATISEVKRTIKNSALADLRRKVETAAAENAKLNKELPIVSQILIGCTDQYNIQALSAEGKKTNGSIFPPTTDGKEEDFYASYLKINNTAGALVWLTGKEPFYSLDTCSKAETAFIAGRNKFAVNQQIINSAKSVNIPQLQTYTYTTIKGAKENGWIGIALLPAQRALAKKADSEITQNIKQEGLVFTSFSPLKIYEDLKNWNLQKTAESYIGRSSMMLVPGAQSIYSTSKDTIHGTLDLMSLLWEIPLVGTKAAADQSGAAGAVITLGGATAASAGSAVLLRVSEVLKGLISSMGAHYIATEIAQIVMETLPYLVVVGVAGLAIALYHAELLFFTLALPFAGAAAFWNGQSNQAIEIAWKGLSIAFKPVLIVVSVFVAVHVADFFHSITFSLIEQQNALMIAANKAQYAADGGGSGFLSIFSGAKEHANSSWFGGLGSYLVNIGKTAFVKSIILIIATVLEVYLTVKIIISGPSMFLSYLKNNLPDATSMAEGIVSKTSRYEQAI